MITLDPSVQKPSAPLIEQAVLSIILNNPECLDLCPALTEEHFYGPGNAQTFSVLVDFVRALQPGVKIDFVGFVNHLSNIGALDRIGGPAALHDILNRDPLPTHLQRHLTTLNAMLARRRAVSASLRLGNAAFDEIDIQDVLDAASSPITSIHDAVGEIRPPRSTKDLIRCSLNRYLERVKGIAPARGLDTGIEELDAPLKGIHPGRMWVIGAYPSGGKSVIAGQIAVRMAINGNPTLFLSLEMSEDDLMDRCLIQAGKVPADAFVDPKGFAAMDGKENPTEGIKRALGWAAEKLLESPFLVRKPPNRSLHAVIATIRRAHREKPLALAVVDYVQLIRVSGMSGNKEGEISEISHSLQELAQDLGITILVLTQLNADGDTKHGRVIEEDADAFIQIIQDMDKASDTFKQHLHVMIVKDRHYGNSGRIVPLIFDKENIRFVGGQNHKTKDKPKTRRIGQ